MTDDESPSPDDFDYGERLDDGQFENHPTTDEGEFVQPVRMRYEHEKCGGTTKMDRDLAASVARDPGQYSKTFCATCGEYVPVDDVHWKADGEPWDMTDD